MQHQGKHQALDVLPAAQPEPVSDQPCPYLTDRRARLAGHAFVAPDSLAPAQYDRLLSANYRRAGAVVYRPQCATCTACRSLRVVVDRFTLTRSLRRVARLNADLRVELARPQPSAEAFQVYRRYLENRHDGTMSADFVAFVSFLYASPTDTWELSYRAGDRLVAVSIVDRVPTGLSSVYAYFNPDDSWRSPGTFTAIWEIEYCRREGLPYYYLGYYVEGSPKMDYKARFRPNQILDEQGRWTAFRPAIHHASTPVLKGEHGKTARRTR